MWWFLNPVWAAWRRRRRRFACRDPSPAGDDVVLRFGANAVRLAHLYEGLLATGATGAGKTSTVLTEVPLALLERGAGGLWLTAKVDEVDRAVALVRRAGREKDLVLVGPGHPAAADLLADELAQCGDADNGAQMLDVLMELGARADPAGGERFWRDAAARLVRQALTVLLLAGERCSFANLYLLLTSMPRSAAEARGAAWAKESFCAECVGRLLPQKTPEAVLAARYVLQEYAGMPDKMQASVSTMALTTVARFMGGSIAPLVSAEEPNVSPRDVLAGKVVVMAYPVQVGRETARAMQLAWKFAVQRAVLRRPVSPDMVPVMVVADEAQNFLLPDVDVMTQAVARSSRLISVNAFQNLPLMFAAMGGGEKARQEVHGWCSNLRVKFIGSNDDSETNQYFSDLFGQYRELLFGGGGSQAPYNAADEVFGTHPPGNSNFHEAWAPLVRPEAFTRLRTGGPLNGFLVDMFLFLGGRTFDTGQTHLPVCFRQRA